MQLCRAHGGTSSRSSKKNGKVSPETTPSMDMLQPPQQNQPLTDRGFQMGVPFTAGTGGDIAAAYDHLASI
jgi:hypothetical protein